MHQRENERKRDERVLQQTWEEEFSQMTCRLEPDGSCSITSPTETILWQNAQTKIEK